MIVEAHLPKRLILAAAMMALTAGAVQAKSPSDKFFEAYYLEVERGDYAAAAKLYEDVASKADGKLRKRAKRRLAECREELATSDFARLMPADTLAYFEINKPGDQVQRLLEMVGLLGEPIGEGESPADGPRVAVSPRLIKAVLGIRGAAVAVTGFDPSSEMPQGVAVLHPGSVEAIRGLIETGLPAAALPQEPVGGYPVYNIEDEMLVCLTGRLIIVSPQRERLTEVVNRLNGKGGKSLADNDELAEMVAAREDALVSCFINARAVVPMALAMAGDDPDVHMAATLLDIKSLRSVSASVGVSEDAIFLDASVRLDSGHHNLAYNLIRTPPLSKQAFASVPQGSAAFLAAALSESGGSTKSSDIKSVTGLDIGREIFSNIIDVVAFVTPPEKDGRSEEGSMVPDIGVVIRVQDPSRSEALWTQILGIASLCAGAPTMDGEGERIEGVTARIYQFPQVAVRLAIKDDRLLISTTRSALSQAISAFEGGSSIVDDKAFASSLGRLSSKTSKALWVHPGRCLQVARPFMSESDYREAQQFGEMMTSLVAMAMTDESDEELHVAVTVSGLPKVGPMLSQMLEHEHRGNQRRRQVRSAQRSNDWDGAASTLERMIAEDPHNLSHYTELFELLALHKHDRSQAKKCLKKIAEMGSREPVTLNNLAWSMLTEESYDNTYDDEALKLAEMACKATKYDNWAYVDTLALAKFRAGAVHDAIKLQRKAIELHGGDDSDLQRALERYEAAQR